MASSTPVNSFSEHGFPYSEEKKSDQEPSLSEEKVNMNKSSNLKEESSSYQEHKRFLTWRKHVRNLYQQLFFIDLVWESPVAQLMPFATAKDDTTTQTILCGTRTGGQEQNYLQLLAATLPSASSSLEGGMNDITREVGGYGYAPHLCGLKIDRRLLHDGDVLAARYMPANPLLIGSCSSNGDTYIFDWSRISLNKFPNDPPRPRASLPPNELSEHSTEEERIAYQKRMRALNAAAVEQDKWDSRTGPGQHTLTLKGNRGVPYSMDWSIAKEGILGVGSSGKVCVWQVAELSKEDPRVLDPLQAFELNQLDDEKQITSVQFLPDRDSESTFLASSEEGAVTIQDLRAGSSTELFSLSYGSPSSLSVSPLNPSQLLVGADNGKIFSFDLRMSAVPVQVAELHKGEVTTLQWCPHSAHLFASGGLDGTVCIYNLKREMVLFRHASHAEGIMDLGWSWQEGYEGQLISCDANSISLWRPRDYFFVA